MVFDPVSAVRARASALLATQGERAAALLRKAIKEGMTLELRRRVEILLAKLEQFTPPAPELRALRAVAALERIGTPEARQVLQGLAGGAPGALVTVQAQAALGRFK